MSTDDEEIKQVALEAGAAVPFMRPASISDDHTGTLAVINHAIEWFAGNYSKPDYVCTLYATAPFVRSTRLRAAFERLQQTPNKSFCFGVTEFSFPIQRAVKIDKAGTPSMFQPEHFESRSQDLENAYHDAGQFYWGKAEGFLRGERMFGETSVAYVLPSYEVQDIDTLDDWVRAEAMYRVLAQQRDQEQ